MSDLRWDQMTIPGAARRAAEQFGDATAVVDDGTTLSFRQLHEQALAATRAFIDAGIEPGDRVAVWGPNIHEWIIAALGIQAAGGVLVTINTRWKAREVGYGLRKSGAKLLCTVGDFLGVNYAEQLEGEELPELRETIRIRGDAKRGIAWSDFLARGAKVPLADAEARAAAVAPGDVSDLLFTSGTTGSPKAVMATHGQSLKVFETWARCVGLREGDRYLIVMPFFHSFGYKAGWLACLIQGAAAYPHAVFDVQDIMERIQDEQLTVLPGSPTIYQDMLSFPERERFDLSSLRLAVTGAAAIPVELIRRMRSELGFDSVITAYGLTESCGTVSMCHPDDDPETIANSAGRAIPDVEVRCVDPEGNEVPRGEPGEVVVRGYNVMKGYFDDDDATAEAIDADGWLHTGDIAVMDERGYLRITDRIKDMYINGGFNVYPAEIENLLFEHEQVAQAAVIGIPNERAGEVGMAFVVPTPGASLDPNALRDWCRENMANYKVPRRIRVVPELPMNAMGKVTKFVLREWAEQPD